MIPITLHDSIKPAWFGPSWSCQICLNPVWRMGCEGENNVPSEAGDRNDPLSQAGFSDKFGDEARDQTDGLI